MTPTPEKQKRKSKTIYMEKGAVEVKCETCKHHDPEATSLDDVPAVCWSCVSYQNSMGFALPFYEPREE